jgi:hypothetical protein
VARLLFYPVKNTAQCLLWRVSVPKGSIGHWHVSFKRKAKAEEYHRACKRELRRTKKVSFLTSSHKLFDAIEALRLLEAVSGPWQNKLRRAAALYLLCCEEQEKKIAQGYSEPLSRGIELQPGLFRALTRLARERNVHPNDLVAGLTWKFVKEESEKVVKRHEYPNEEKIPLRMLL